MIKDEEMFSRKVAKKIKFIMTDVDDTITSSDGNLGDEVKQAISRLQDEGITVGLISGRGMPSLQNCAQELNVNGPIVAENGGQVKLHSESRVINLGDREITQRALLKLKNRFGAAINISEHDQGRVTDLILSSRDVPIRELRKHLEETEIIETSYFSENGRTLHLAQKGVNKGSTLVNLLKQIGNGSLHTHNTLVLGDGLNDLSLFQLFPHSVLVPNPNQPLEHTRVLRKAARYLGKTPGGAGFAEVIRHFIQFRMPARARRPIRLEIAPALA